MKSCAYCGKANEDAATACAGCGTTFEAEPNEVDNGQAEMGLRHIVGDPVRLFRALVLVSTGTFLIWFFHLLAGNRFISEATWDVLAWNGYGALLPLPARLAWLFLLLYVAVAAGLWMFSGPARLVFTALIAFTVITSLLGGLSVQTAFGSFLLWLTNLADGAILVLAYTPPLKERFE